MHVEEPINMSIAIEALNKHVGAGVAQIQQAAAVAFAAVDPEKAHQEADRLAKALRAEQLLKELVDVLEGLDLKSANGAAKPTGEKRKPITRGGSRLPDGPALHREALADPVLAALRHHGGTASLRQIWAYVEDQLRVRFTKSDLDGMKSHRNEPRWQYNVRWTLTDLRHEGKVEHTDRRGVWRLAI